MDASGVTTRRAPLVLKRMGPARVALAAGIATTLLTISFVAALVSFTQTRTATAIRAALSRPDSLAVTITSSLSAQQQPQARAAISAQLRQAFGPVPFALFGSLRVDGLALRGAAGRAAGHGGPAHRIATVIAADALAAHATLVTGRWPATAPATGPGAAPGARPGGRPVPVAISAAAAGRLGVSAGGILALRSPYDRKDVRLRVTGIFRPDDPAAPYWQLDPLHGAGFQEGGGFATFGPLFTSAGNMRSGPLSATLAGWVAMPTSADRMISAGLRPLGVRLSSALGRLPNSAAAGNPVATSPLPGLLAGLSSAALISRSLLLIGLLELLVLGGATLTLMARALAGERRAETALLRARGGAERQLLGLGAAESTLVVLPAVLLGPLLGIWLASGLASGWSPVPGAAAPGEVPASLWLTAVAVAAISLPVLLFPAVRAAISPIGVAAMRGRQRAIGAASRAGADLALVALAVAACWELAKTSDALTVASGGQLSLDPILVAAPVLAAPACSVLILRALPLVARLADRSAAKGRRVVLPLASWSIGRRPLRHAGPLLITVISLAIAVLAISQYQTGRQTASQLAAFGTGSDYRADLPYGPLPLGQVSRLASLTGASAVMPAVRTTATLASDSATVTVLGLASAKMAATVLLRGDLTTEPLAELGHKITPAGAAPGRALPGRPSGSRSPLGWPAQAAAAASPARSFTFRSGTTPGSTTRSTRARCPRTGGGTPSSPASRPAARPRTRSG